MSDKLQFVAKLRQAKACRTSNCITTDLPKALTKNFLAVYDRGSETRKHQEPLTGKSELAAHRSGIAMTHQVLVLASNFVAYKPGNLCPT